MPLERFTTRSVLANQRGNDAARTRYRDRVRPDVFLPELRDGPKIGRASKLFTVGSCFARNIERTLYTAGVNCPSFKVIDGIAADHGEVLDEEPRFGIFNKYTPPAIANEISWIAENAPTTQGIYQVDETRSWSSQLHWKTPAPHDVVEDITARISAYSATAFDADLVIMTLGLVECWFDKERKLYLNEKPPGRLALDPRFECHTLSYGECKAEIFRVIRTITEQNRDAHVVVTVSPVTLASTMSREDVRVRNSYSKSVLRAVAEEACMRFERAVYFPSYEMATLSDRKIVYSEDNIHIRQDFVDTIIHTFLTHYADPSLLETREMAVPTFSAALVLQDPGVAEAHFDQFSEQMLENGDIQEVALLFQVAGLLQRKSIEQRSQTKLNHLLGTKGATRLLRSW